MNHPTIPIGLRVTPAIVCSNSRINLDSADLEHGGRKNFKIGCSSTTLAGSNELSSPSMSYFFFFFLNFLFPLQAKRILGFSLDFPTKSGKMKSDVFKHPSPLIRFHRSLLSRLRTLCRFSH